MREAELVRYGQRMGVRFALVGLGLALLLTGLLGVLQVYLGELPWVVLGAIAAVLFCGSLGGKIAGRLVARGWEPLFCGVGAALSAVVLPTLFCALPFALRAKDLEDFIKVMIAPLFWILLYGGLPMLLLGFVYGFFLRAKALRS